jgi:metallophosphoesterase superfamily enzyme
MAKQAKRRKSFRPRLRGQKKQNHDYWNKEERRVLGIGDLHLPFTHKDYLQFCIDTYNNYNCTDVVLLGDIRDGHAESFHLTDPNGWGAGKELNLAKEQVKDWYKAFPNAYVCVGNHDALHARKLKAAGVPQEWLKSYQEVLGTPNWEFVTEVYIDGVRYVHGHKSGKPRTAAKRDMVSTVSGHYHTDFYVEYFFGVNRRVFACATGCGIDSEKYAFEYMSGGKAEALGCSVIIGGHTAIPVAMELGNNKKR